MKYSKKKPEGFLERKEILEKVCKCSGEIIEFSLLKYQRKDLAKDDILDALVAALTAKKGSNHGFVYVPDEPETDSRELKKQIIYFSSFTNLESVNDSK